jgi:MoxR-like ATPase
MLTVRAQALLEGRLVPTNDDVARMAIPVLIHRMQLTFAARARGEGLRPLIEQVAARATRSGEAAA